MHLPRVDCFQGKYFLLSIGLSKDIPDLDAAIEDN